MLFGSSVGTLLLLAPHSEVLALPGTDERATQKPTLCIYIILMCGESNNLFYTHFFICIKHP